MTLTDSESSSKKPDSTHALVTGSGLAENRQRQEHSETEKEQE